MNQQTDQHQMTESKPDVIIIMTDEERAAPPYESSEITAWRDASLAGERWFARHAVTFKRHYTGSLACVPSRPTLFTGQYPDLHGVTQTDGLGKMADDSRLRWLRPGEVPTLGNWFRAAGYDTHYDGKWHISHAQLTDPATGGPLATNDAKGKVDREAVRAYLGADLLNPYGFSGWVGPEPHGAPLANSGFCRDPLIAARVRAWLEDRYDRRRAGDETAIRPFLLVASFVNPHDIVLWPLWARRGLPFPAADLPPVPPAPTAEEDLGTKPAAQRAYRASYPTAYGPAPVISRAYDRRAEEYRQLYYQLHAQVDAPIDQIRRTVTENGSLNAVIVRTSDHGELLGAHGGLHQKWFNLYDEATRVPFSIVRLRDGRCSRPKTVTDPTSHVDLVPTLLAAAEIGESETASQLASAFSEVHPLPGQNLMPVVDGDDPDPFRAVYLMTRDNILEGDSGASAVARRRGRVDNPPLPLRIRVPANVGSSFEGIVVRSRTDVAGRDWHLWKLVRTFDDPTTWTEPEVRHLDSTGMGGSRYRTATLADQWELYDLTLDPTEADNRWADPMCARVFSELQSLLIEERKRCVPTRNSPWPYANRRGSAASESASKTRSPTSWVSKSGPTAEAPTNRSPWKRLTALGWLGEHSKTPHDS